MSQHHNYLITIKTKRNVIILWLGHFKILIMSEQESSLNNSENLVSLLKFNKVFLQLSTMFFLNLRHQVDNDLPHVLVGLHVSVSLGNVLQVEHWVNHGHQGAHLVRELWEHSVCESLYQVCFVLRKEKRSEGTQLKDGNWKNTQTHSPIWQLSLTWWLRERRRLASKWPRLDSSLPRRSPSTVLPPMVP